MKMHSNAVTPIAISMLSGASLQRMPESCPKKAKYGILIPECSITPAEATSRPIEIQINCPPATAESTIDLVTNPLNRGNAEIEAAPIRQKTVVYGIDRYNPPNSVALIVPARYSTAPIAMNSSDL